MEQIVAREVGAEGIARMVAGFYRRVKTDDLIGPLYPDDDWEGAEQRLREFLQFRFLGDESYIANRGHPRLRMRHFPFVIKEAHRNRWIELMEAAMDEANITGEARAVISPFFAQVAEAMRNH
jgi:hemoglobin